MTTSINTAPSAEELAGLNERFAGARPEELVAWAGETYRDRLGLSCSFGGASGMVLVDLAVKAAPTTTVFYVDTAFLFPETYATVEAVRAKYGIEPLALRTSISPERQAEQFGPALWERDPDQCCDIRKVQPMRHVSDRFSAYFTGVRRDQASTRSETPLLQWDAKFGMLKINPLVSWSEKDVWSYIMAHDLPYNPLHDRNYPSIGCTYCTKPVNPGDDPRSGRWAGNDKIECGLHTA